MSFLAQLRQNQYANTEVHLQLCYLLNRSSKGQVSLSLYLCQLNDLVLRERVKPYILQREHLQQPPPFLVETDTRILSSLVKTSDEWLNTNEHCLFPAQIAEFLEALIATRKCFIEDFVTGWRILSLGAGYPTKPIWCLDSWGVQTLTWTKPTDASVFTVNKFPFVLDFERALLRKGDPSDLTLVSRVAEQVPLDQQAVSHFLHTVGNDWQENGLPLPLELSRHVLSATLTPVLYFSEDHCSLRFRYTSELFSLMCQCSDLAESLSVWNGVELLTVERNKASEGDHLQELHSLLNEFEFIAPALWKTTSKDIWQTLLLSKRKNLETLGFAFQFSKTFKYHYVAPQSWSLDVSSEDAKFWQFSLSFDADGRELNLLSLLQELRQYNHQNRCDLQEFLFEDIILVFSSEMLESLTSELNDLIAFNHIDGPIPLAQIQRLKSLKDCLPDDTRCVGDTQLLCQAIDLSSSPILIDNDCSGVNATLRPYQWLGVCWLQHLKKCRFNGLLADDMGLGKTLQALAHLSLEHNNDPRDEPSLIIVPTSLLANWVAEIQQFCPHLSHIVIHGNNRHQQWESIKGKHLVITSYPILVKDLALWQARSFNWLVLDEAQVIKNVGTKVSQAVRSLQSNWRLCLSGTPVENHLGELWSVLDFLVPGILGSQRQFKEIYQTPIEVDGNVKKFNRLLKQIEPFIMRRTKLQVAKDLPPKTKIKKMVSLSTEQLAFYEHLKTSDKENLNEQLLNSENSGQKQILLLTALTRLRQACCDPLLLSEDVRDGEIIQSAKTEFCLEMLVELVDEGRSVLVFSQFTSMLNILADRLSAMKLDYLLLTGKSKKRSEIVDQFQSGKAPIFLISLKAGGVGLNLTRADTVIHFDPWWNQSAEDQASDRAHRIGQINPVFVYKLIAEGTIEEKISLMQERKSLISQQINHQAQVSGETFALKLEDLLALYE